MFENQRRIIANTYDNFFAMESAAVSGRLLNEDGEPLKIALITDKVIKAAKLKQVTNPIMFNRGDLNSNTEDGLFSTAIFGENNDERKRQCGYIDLHVKFFHPYVYEVLVSVVRNVEQVAAGQFSWKITDKGELKKVKPGDVDYEEHEDDTGLAWLIENYHRLQFTTNNSLVRSDRVKFLTSLTEEQTFISKWLVIARFYRDVEILNGRRSVPDINYEYTNLIQYANSMENDIFAFYNTKARYAIQRILVKIRKYGQELISHKNGAFHKMIMGKSTDYGSLDVISVPVMGNYQRPNDMPIDILHSGVPLAKCLVVGYPFIIRYCVDFFKDNFSGSDSGVLFIEKGGEYIPSKSAMKLKDPSQIYTKAFLDKRINEYKNSHSTRFDIITVEDIAGNKYPIRMAGKYTSLDTHNPKSSGLLSRPMTWTDLFYLAAVDTLSDKYVYIVRYPLTDYSGVFPSLCMPLSTLKTVSVVVNGKVYPYYPDIDLSLTPDQVATRFIDTVTMSNLYLSALGGDYDGDTVGVKMVYTVEANAEARRIASSPAHYISVEGDMIRDVGNEAYQSFYNITKYED